MKKHIDPMMSYAWALGAIIFAALHFLFVHPFVLLFTYPTRKKAFAAFRERMREEKKRKQEEDEEVTLAIKQACEEMELRKDSEMETICQRHERALINGIANQMDGTKEAVEAAIAEIDEIMRTYGERLRTYLEPVRQFAKWKRCPHPLKNHHWRTAVRAFREQES